ncbi:MAG: glycoside hydrolase family 127 protein [Candidatus Hydrogenedentes bacterium]|nr:glycoside hydrolase family 127 protein [Candidatus Hydrogenedentota bacterium]
MHIKHFLKPRRSGLLTWIVGLAMPAALLAAPAPFAKVHPLELDAVHWSSGFWAERFASFRTDLLPSMRRLMEDNHYSQYFRNFEIAAGLAEGDYRGAPFNDGDYYKLLEAECATYAVTRLFLERGIRQKIRCRCRRFFLGCDGGCQQCR